MCFHHLTRPLICPTNLSRASGRLGAVAVDWLGFHLTSPSKVYSTRGLTLGLIAFRQIQTSTKMATPAIPTSIAAVVMNKPGGTEVLEYKTDLPVPQLKAGEILVKNEYIGINFIDT